jgi:hypothetical protein
MNSPYDVLVPELKLTEYTGLDDEAALAHLRSKTMAIVWGISWATLTTWAAGNGVRALIQIGADNLATDAGSIGIRAICLTLLDNLRGSLDTTMLDMTSPATTGLLDALVSASILTTAQKAELIALGTINQPLAWASSVGLGNVTSARQLIAQGA